MRARRNWVHASAHRLKRAPAGADGDAEGFPGRVGEVPQQSDFRRASDRPSHLPDAGTLSAPSFIESLRVDLFFLHYAVALRAMDRYATHPFLVPAHSRNPLEVRGAFLGSRISVFGRPWRIRMGEWW